MSLKGCATDVEFDLLGGVVSGAPVLTDITVTTPVTEEDGGMFMAADTLKDMALQHLKVLMLTNPGQMTMKPHLGVGISRILFEQDTMALRTDLVSVIKSQIGKYIPYITVADINLSPMSDDNTLSVGISFYISYETSVYGPYLARWVSSRREQGSYGEGDGTALGDGGAPIYNDSGPASMPTTPPEYAEQPSPLSSAKISSSPVFSGQMSSPLSQALAGPIATFLVTR